ncbi:hypothetical protein CY34DRAFT_802961 [Suillus luteus UH-Slu-Lm8-n1]|uniref:Uncharacterized protein n=1 Tax=Suillus luteus UH-Slu-Lm8-n1 TaxID=930992 RepID=A0A0D0A2G5_9AGAM|nr:hypothetical protein CY34DRAFT_802961 [Suillus luteus UH-Slu-Lm8-n1]
MSSFATLYYRGPVNPKFYLLFLHGGPVNLVREDSRDRSLIWIPKARYPHLASSPTSESRLRC